MGRKKTRGIVIGESAYTWRCSPINQSYNILKIWGNQQRDTLRVRFRFDDPWCHYPEMLSCDPSKVDSVFQTMPITPYSVRMAIEAAIRMDWEGPLELAWIDQEFVIVEDATQVPNDRYDKNTGHLQRPPKLDE